MATTLTTPVVEPLTERDIDDLVAILDRRVDALESGYELDRRRAARCVELIEKLERLKMFPQV